MRDGNGRRGLRTWIEVEREAIACNYRIFRALIGGKRKLMAVVKSNAYGHNLFEFSKEMERLGADFLGVDSAVEARALRRAGIKTPILILGYTLPAMLAEAVRDGVGLTVSSPDALAAIAKAKLPAKAKVHIKVDTGMGRQGFSAKDLPKILGLLKLKAYRSKLEAEGLYTHFAAAKNPAFPEATNAQLAEFEKWVSAFKEAGFSPIVHAAATAGAMLFPQSHFDMARIGIGLYGLWPAKETERFLTSRFALQPVLSWKTVIGEIKRLPKGNRVGYDLTETLARDSVLAICPVGYWHGYPRVLSSVGKVLVRGREAKVIGRVSMDMTTVDVTGIPGVKVGDEVVLIGKSGKMSVSAKDLAALSDSSWYEIVTRINPLIKRIYY